MVKVYIFNKSNNVSRFDIFKTFFECVNSKIRDRRTTFVLSFFFHLSLLYCHYCYVMRVTVMPVSAYMALAFVFGFIQIN